MAKRRVTVRALVINEENKILVLRRSQDDDSVPGRVDFPGGGMEENESPETSVKREIEEESGIRVTERDLKLAYTFTVYDNEIDAVVIRLLYITRAGDDSVRLGHEHDAFWWHTLDEVKQLFSNISWSEAITFLEQHGLPAA